MSKRECVVCGKDPAEGFASIYRDGKEQWYCHPDEGESCYVGSTWSDVVATIRAMPIEEVREEIQKRRDRLIDFGS